MITRLSSLAVLGTVMWQAVPSSLRTAEPAPTRELRDLNKSYFPFTPVNSKEAWDARRAEARRRVLVASSLWPMPAKTPLKAVVHGRLEREDYTVEKVFFESLPGHFVCGNLYLPKPHGDKMPAVICPHGHWPNGRFMVANDATVKKEIASGAEKIENAARSPLQARCVQLARMGCAVFHYDMLGYADSVQFCDAEGRVLHRHGPRDRGFLSVEAEQQLVGYFPLQTWNSVRALDFMSSLPYVDKTRLGCTGASGGGTQTMIISAIDERVAAAFPCVMVSTAMQGGCTCENSHHLRIGMGNIEIAALTAPRPLGLTAADDWTKELETKGFPDLKNLYTMLGVPDHVEAHFNIQFPHNYNGVSRAQMYAFFNKHFKLGLSEAQLQERDFTFSMPEELTVWSDRHPKPSGDQVGEPHEIAVVEWFKQEAHKQLAPLLAPKTKDDLAKQREVLGGAWDTMLATKLPRQGEAAFALGTKEDRGRYFVLRGAINGPKHALDGTFLYPKDWNGTTVVWTSLKGEAALLNTNGDLTATAEKLLAECFAIASPRLYLLDATKNPNVYANGKRKLDGFEGYAGYHYGYNPSLFAERVSDVLTTLAMIRDHEQYKSRNVVLVGAEGAGAIAVAATTLARSVVSQLYVDTEGFRFSNLTDVWDVNFIPGAAKYGDVPALLSLCAPVKTFVLGETEDSAKAVRATFATEKATLELAGTPQAGGAEALVQAVVERK